MNDAGSPLVSATGLGLDYPGRPGVLRDVSFQLPAGGFVGVIGENGSGKSSLLACLVGLRPPTRGQIEVRARASFLAQKNTIPPYFPATVTEIVRSGWLAAAPARRERGDETRATTGALAALQLSDLAKTSFAALSGGQQQRVLIARTLAATTDLIVLDEPTNNLDHAINRQIYTQLRRYQRQRGLTVIMATHDLERLRATADYILYLERGQLAYVGPAATFSWEGASLCSH